MKLNMTARGITRELKVVNIEKILSWVNKHVSQHRQALIPLTTFYLPSFWCFPPDSRCHL